MNKRAIILPLRLIGTMMLVIFVAEAVIMLGFFLVGENEGLFSGLLDATMLSLLIAPAMYHLIFQPMSQQQRRLQRSQRWLQTITENLPEALIEMNSQGMVNAFNPAAEVMFGYTAAEMIGKSVNTLLPEGEERDYDAFVRLYLATGNSHMVGTAHEITAQRRDGSLFPAGIQLREVHFDGKLNFIALIRDLTHHKLDLKRREQMQERIERTQRLESLGVLAGGIAHDFNNILAAIMGNAELLEMRLGQQAQETHECLGNIQTGCSRASDLCRQMLAYAGRGQYRLDYIDLNELLQDMDSLIHLSVPSPIKVEKHLANPLPTIRADKAQVEQVVLNLLSNAAEAISDKENGRIAITTRTMYAKASDLTMFEHGDELQPGPYVLLEVQDNGEGIPAEDLPHLFEPFFTTKFTGRGLGMSAVLGILRAHQGGVGIESQLGDGTSVRMLLPVRQKREMPQEQPSKVEPFDVDWTGSGTVLVVDDEPQFRHMVCKMLHHLGFETIEAKDGQEGLEMAAQHRDGIAAVLLDLTMPVMGGEEAFLQLRGRYPEMPVLIASGYGEATLRDIFGTDGPEGFVSKPFRYGALRRALYGIARVPPQVGKPDQR